jgi:hypothetical protein
MLISSSAVTRPTPIGICSHTARNGDRLLVAVKNRWPGSGVRLLDCSYRSSGSERQVCDALPPLDRRAPGPAIDPEPQQASVGFWEVQLMT